MNSFLSLVTNPFAENRPFAQPRPVSPMPVKAISVTPTLNPPRSAPLGHLGCGLWWANQCSR
jgi:hypothetical protein